jgi:hypothetical protein
MPRIIAFFHLLLLLSSITISAIAISAWESFEENDDLLTFNDARTMFCVKCMAKELQEVSLKIPLPRPLIFCFPCLLAAPFASQRQQQQQQQQG